MPSTEPDAGPSRARPDRPKELPRKLFYKIGSVCNITGTQPYILRFWESEFPQLAPQKSRSGQRLFRERDVEMVLRIKRLLYEEGYTIAGARKRLEQEEAERAGREPSAGPAPAIEPPPAPQAPPAEEVRPAGPERQARERGSAGDARRVKEMRVTLREVRKELQMLLRRLNSR
jgi:DNA-binding transcriptional MerR regulator